MDYLWRKTAMTRYEKQCCECICMSCALAKHLSKSCHCNGPMGSYNDERNTGEHLCPRTKSHRCWFKNSTCKNWRAK